MRAFPSPSSRDAAIPELTSISAAKARTTASSRVSGFPARQEVEAVAHFHGIAGASASGWFMSVIRAEVFTPAPLATSTSDCARSFACSWSAMKAPLPVLTSSTSVCETGSKLLGQDGGRDQRNGIDGGGDIAHGVELAVGRRQRAGLADDGAACLLDDLAEQRRIRRDSYSREWIPACRACRRYGRGRGRRSSARQGRRQPRSAPASARRCRRRRRSNVCRRSGDRYPAHVQHVAGARHRERQRNGLVARHALEPDGHGEGADLSFGQLAGGKGLDEGLISSAASTPPLRFCRMISCGIMLNSSRPWRAPIALPPRTARISSSRPEAPKRKVDGIGQSGVMIVSRKAEIKRGIRDRADAAGRLEADLAAALADRADHDVGSLKRRIDGDLAGGGLDEIGAGIDCKFGCAADEARRP